MNVISLGLIWAPSVVFMPAFTFIVTVSECQNADVGRNSMVFPSDDKMTCPVYELFLFPVASIIPGLSSVFSSINRSADMMIVS